MQDVASFLSVQDVADRVQVKLDTVYGWIKSGELPAINMAANRSGQRPRWRIDEQALAAFLAARTASKPPANATRQRSHKRPDDVEYF